MMKDCSIDSENLPVIVLIYNVDEVQEPGVSSEQGEDGGRTSTSDKVRKHRSSYFTGS